MKTPIRRELDGEITTKVLKEISCLECEGYGNDGEHWCPACGGTGYAPQNKTDHLTVPAGDPGVRRLRAKLAQGGLNAVLLKLRK